MAEKLEDFSLGSKMKSKQSLKKAGIVGCGSTGQQIVRTISKFGIDVVFVDISEQRIKEIFSALNHSMDKIIEKWGMTTSEKKAILSRIKGSVDYEDLRDCDIIVETIHSKKPGTSLEMRKEVFRKIEAVVSPNAIIASNTATLMISNLAAVLKNPDRAIGMHFLYPWNEAEYVEVVRTAKTSDATFDNTLKFLKMIGKDALEVNESPGNISTRLIVTLINDACDILMEGVASVQDVDTIMKQVTGHQLGPFELADRIGLDKIEKWMENLFYEFGDRKYKCSPVIRRLVRAGMVGERAGEGFYIYSDGKRKEKEGSILNLGRE